MPLTIRAGPSPEGVPASLDGGSSLTDTLLVGFATRFTLANCRAETPIVLPEVPIGATPAVTQVEWRQLRMPRWLGGEQAGLLTRLLWSERSTLFAGWRWGSVIGPLSRVSAVLTLQACPR